MLTDADVQTLAEGWVAYWREYKATGEFPKGEANANRVVDKLVFESPELGWRATLAILEIIEAEPSDPLFQVLAAGPLEDLLAEHGPELIERVESRAQVDERFRLLLGGVWQNAMTDETWSRVQRVRGSHW